MLKLVLFADDTTLSKSGHVLNDLFKIVSTELDRLQVWFNVNRLSLNLAKTLYMIFSGKKAVQKVQVRVNGCVLKQVKHTKFLGVIVDDKLSWNKHIECVTSKVAKSTSVLYKAKFVLNKESLRMIYYTLIYPILIYCVEIWGNTYKSRLHQIVMLQKRCIRNICNSHRLASTNMLFLQENMLK